LESDSYKEHSSMQAARDDWRKCRIIIPLLFQHLVNSTNSIKCLCCRAASPVEPAERQQIGEFTTLLE